MLVAPALSLIGFFSVMPVSVRLDVGVHRMVLQHEVHLLVAGGDDVQLSFLGRKSGSLGHDLVRADRQRGGEQAAAVGLGLEVVGAQELERGLDARAPAPSATLPRTLPVGIFGVSDTSTSASLVGSTTALSFAGSKPGALTSRSVGPGGSAALSNDPSGSVATRARGRPADRDDRARDRRAALAALHDAGDAPLGRRRRPDRLLDRARDDDRAAEGVDVQRERHAEDDVVRRQRRAVRVADRAQRDVDAGVEREPAIDARARAHRDPVLVAVVLARVTSRFRTPAACNCRRCGRGWR